MEYKYVSFHPGALKSPEAQAELITEQMNLWAARGWRIVNVLRHDVGHPVQLVLEKES